VALHIECAAIDRGRAAEIRDFFAAHPVPDAQRSLQQALERIDVCSAVRKSQSGVLADWLAGR